MWLNDMELRTNTAGIKVQNTDPNQTVPLAFLQCMAILNLNCTFKYNVMSDRAALNLL